LVPVGAVKKRYFYNKRTCECDAATPEVLRLR
jgi:hypothetical protein